MGLEQLVAWCRNQVKINTQDQSKLLRTWIILVIVQHHLVQIGRIDGPTKDLEQLAVSCQSQARVDLI